MTQTIVCMKWGTRYPAEFANRLWSMIKRNTRRPTRLVCYTDDQTGLDPEIEAYPLPPITLPKSAELKPWRKLSLWAPTLPGISGDVLFLDLDIVVTGNLDDFFDFEPAKTFCVIENWTQMGKGIGNTSVYRFRVGADTYIYDRFEANAAEVLANHPLSQVYISRTINQMTYWPAPWCVSFKHTLMPRWPLNFFQTTPLPPATKVVAFTGKPDPDDARDGRWPTPSLWKRTYKFVKPTPWIDEHWR